jgi:MFS family permease
MILSFLLWGIVCLCFITCQSRPVVALTFILFGAHKGALDPVQKTLVSELAPCGLRASCLGGFQMVIGLCALPASLIAGILWERAGLNYPLYFSLFLTAIATGLLFFVKKH